MGPRDLLIVDHRALFGRAARLDWRNADSVEDEVLLRAAQMQHSAALELRTALRDRSEHIGELAERFHVNAESLRRKLRGEAWANLRDTAAWMVYAER